MFQTVQYLPIMFKEERGDTVFKGGLCRQQPAGSPSLVLNAISERTLRLRQEYVEETRKNHTPTKNEKVARLLGSSSLKAVATIPSGVDGQITHYSKFRTSIRVHRNVRRPSLDKSRISSRGQIDSFSDKSRGRLRHSSSNCDPELISQFCLTYENENIPADGRATKKHLHRFLAALRRRHEGLSYLWLLEFQWANRGGVPHYHLFLPFSPSPEEGKFMAETWVRITKGSQKALNFHNHSKNFITWDMGKGSYLCKYLEKSEQKHVPAHFENVGRFWGTSRRLVPHPELWTKEDVLSIEIEHVDKLSGEVYVSSFEKVLYRALRKHHETTVRNARKKNGNAKKVKSRITSQNIGVVTLTSGGNIAKQVQFWFYREDLKMKGIEQF